jgi:hypothetical protein
MYLTTALYSPKFSLSMQMQFAPTVVAPAYQVLGSFAPTAAEVMLAGLDRNRAAWERMGACENRCPLGVLTDADGIERALHVTGGSVIERDDDPATCMCAQSCNILLTLLSF